MVGFGVTANIWGGKSNKFGRNEQRMLALISEQRRNGGCVHCSGSFVNVA